MNRIKNITNDLILVVLSLLSFAIILLNLGSLPLIMAILLSSFLIIINLKEIKWYFLILLPINIFSCLCTLLFYEGTGVVLIFLTLFMLCLVVNFVSFSKKTRKIVYLIGAASIILLVVTANSISFSVDWLVLYDVHRNLVNNNTLGMYSVALCFSLLLWNDLRESKKFKKLLSVIIYIVGFACAYITGCRSALFVLLLYFVLHKIIKKELKIKSFRFIVICFLIVSLAFTVFYVMLYSALPNITFLGKSLFSGRELVWKDAFSQIFESPLFGTGTAFLMSGFESPHNMLLGIWKNVGLIPLISIVLAFVVGKRVSLSRKQQIMIISFCLFTFFESFMMDQHFLFLFAFLMLGEKKNKVEEIKNIEQDVIVEKTVENTENIVETVE